MISSRVELINRLRLLCLTGRKMVLHSGNFGRTRVVVVDVLDPLSRERAESDGEAIVTVSFRPQSGRTQNIVAIGLKPNYQDPDALRLEFENGGWLELVPVEGLEPLSQGAPAPGSANRVAAPNL